MSIVTSVLGRALSSSHVSWIELSTSPQTRRSQVARSTSGTLPAWSTGHFSVRYCPGGSRAGSYPFSSSFFSALERNIATTLTAMTPTPFPAARRPRDYVRVSGRDAEDFLQRMLSNDVTQAHCEALLLTPKARVIAPLVVMRRGPDDFLLLTEPGLGDTVRTTLLRARFAAKAEIEGEEHTSTIVFGDADGIPTSDYGHDAVEVLDADVEPTIGDDELELMRIQAGTPRFGREIDDRVLPAEAGLVERAVSLTKGCFPGQEPIARLHYRGHANRGLRLLEVEAAEPGTEIVWEGKSVGRVTSAVARLALGFVRNEVPADAALDVGGRPARMRPPAA